MINITAKFIEAEYVVRDTLAGIVAAPQRHPDSTIDKPTMITDRQMRLSMPETFSGRVTQNFTNDKARVATRFEGAFPKT